jgi:hypothetical protein
MRLIAAAFDDEVAAEAARAGLVHTYGRESIGLSVAPLGRAYDPAGPAAILAGRFDEAVVDAVTADVEDLGGRVVIDIDEARATA